MGCYAKGKGVRATVLGLVATSLNIVRGLGLRRGKGGPGCRSRFGCHLLDMFRWVEVAPGMYRVKRACASWVGVTGRGEGAEHP